MGTPVTWTRNSLKGSTKTQGDFNLANTFGVEIDGISVNGVHTVEGLEHEHEIVEFHDGENRTTQFRPGRQKPGKLTLTKDFSSTKEWFNWRKTVVDGKVERKSVSVVIHNDAGEEAMRYNFYECWASSYKGPSLNARNSAHATESITIVWESFEMK